MRRHVAPITMSRTRVRNDGVAETFPEQLIGWVRANSEPAHCCDDLRVGSLVRLNGIECRITRNDYGMFSTDADDHPAFYGKLMVGNGAWLETVNQ